MEAAQGTGSETALPVDNTISMRGLAKLRSDIRASNAINIAVAIGLGTGILIALYTTWFYWRISSLGHQYGWGAIPTEQYPIEPARIERAYAVLSWIQIIGFVGGAICFLLSISKIRKGLEALLGNTAFFYGWGWTIGSVFIPFVSLYRPWVGFAEVRRAVKGMASRRRISMEWLFDGFNSDTLILGLGYICASIALRVVDAEANTIGSDQDFGLAGVDQILGLSAIEVAARLVIFGVMVWYLRSLVVAARQVAEAATASETFS